jgi:5-methylcytosine-specific restriction endonuclease McrA
MRKTKYTKEVMEKAVNSSESVSGIIRYFGLKPSGGNYVNIKHFIGLYGIDISHFTGQSWSKGKRYETDDRIRRATDKVRSYTNEEIFVKDSPYHGNSGLKKRLIEEGVPEQCVVCGNMGTWMGKSLPLHLDHIDGDRRNNEKENLRFLCPNCHQQTPTWGGKNSPVNEAPRERVRRAYKPIPRKKKIEWPTPQEVLTMLENESYSAVGKVLGVSDNAVRKYLKSKGVEPPKRYKDR